MTNLSKPYAHRRNQDGSYDSICRECFSAVVRRKPEWDLAQYEKAHDCDSSFLAERGLLCRSETSTRDANMPLKAA
jgi:hypothetical protein